MSLKDYPHVTKNIHIIRLFFGLYGKIEVITLNHFLSIYQATWGMDPFALNFFFEYNIISVRMSVTG